MVLWYIGTSGPASQLIRKEPTVMSMHSYNVLSIQSYSKINLSTLTV